MKKYFLLFIMGMFLTSIVFVFAESRFNDVWVRGWLNVTNKTTVLNLTIVGDLNVSGSLIGSSFFGPPNWTIFYNNEALTRWIIANDTSNYLTQLGLNISRGDLITNYTFDNKTINRSITSITIGISQITDLPASSNFLYSNITLFLGVNNESIIKVGNTSWIISNERNPSNATIELANTGGYGALYLIDNFTSNLNSINDSISLWNRTTTAIYPRNIEANVGIGITTPNYLLQVASGTDGRSVNLSNVLYVNGTTNGSVGIGTSAPGSGAGLSGIQEAPLHIYSSANKNTFLLIENDMNGSNTAAVLRTLADSAGMNFQSHATGRTISRFGVTLGGWNEFLSVTGNGMAFGTLGATDLIIGTNSADRIHILSTGNVGIGNSTPAQNLVIQSGTAWSRIDAGATSFTGSSSKELKKNIVEVSKPDILTYISNTSVYSYNFKDCGINSTCKNRTSAMAEDFNQIFNKDAGKGISGDDVMWALWLGIQEQQKEINYLKQLSGIPIIKNYKCLSTNVEDDCPFGLSGGLHTRCYQDINKTIYLRCDEGWV